MSFWSEMVVFFAFQILWSYLCDFKIRKILPLFCKVHLNVLTFRNHKFAYFVFIPILFDIYVFILFLVLYFGNFDKHQHRGLNDTQTKVGTSSEFTRQPVVSYIKHWNLAK
jgi:hypothetical protein